MNQVWKSYHLGLVDYQEAWQLQKNLAKSRGKDAIDNTLLLLEHPHTYTLGSSASYDNLLMTDEQLTEHSVNVYEVDRGGDITYHGPGQLVGYPILKLDMERHGVRIGVVDYIRDLESVIMHTLDAFGISSQRLEGYTGVWVDVDDVLHKIAAIGVKVTARGITFHGFALNVNPDMNFFAGIIPCGISDKPVISMAELLETSISMDKIVAQIEKSFAEIFGVDIAIQHEPTPLI